MEQIKKHIHPFYTEKEMFKGEERTVIAYPHTKFPLGMHSHDFFELNVVTRGEGIHFIGEESCPAITGSAFVLPPRTEHGYLPNVELEIYHILLSNRFFENNGEKLSSLAGYLNLFELEPSVRSKKLFPVLDSSRLAVFLNYAGQLPGLVEDEKEEKEEKAKIDNFIAEEQAKVIIGFLLKWYMEGNTASDTAKSKNHLKILNIMEYICLHYEERIELDELLARSGIASKSTFLRCFGEICGKSPIEYLLSVRLQNASAKLVNTDQKITRIAYDCGFYDATQFAKMFRREYGKSPSEYRKEKQTRNGNNKDNKVDNRETE